MTPTPTPKPFERHARKFYAPRPSWNRQATVNGRPAYEKKENHHDSRDNRV